MPETTPEEEKAAEDEEETNPYKRALLDNEKHKKEFIESLKAEADARKKREAEEKA